MPKRKTTAPQWLELLVKRGLEILQRKGNRDESRTDPAQQFDRQTPDFLEEVPKLLKDLGRIERSEPPKVRKPARVNVIMLREELINVGFDDVAPVLGFGDGISHRQFAMVTPAAIWSHPDLRKRYKRCIMCLEFFIRHSKAPHTLTCSPECQRLSKK